MDTSEKIKLGDYPKLRLLSKPRQSIPRLIFGPAWKWSLPAQNAVIK
jgi:hypothetical protein